jgi:hypothetical protein
MADTKFTAVYQEDELKDGKQIFTHCTDQFTWYADGAPKRFDKYEEEYVLGKTASAIKFVLPHSPGHESSKEIVVVGDGLSGEFQIYFLADEGATAQLKLYPKKTHDRSKGKRIKDLNCLFTTEISPFLYGQVPLPLKRVDYPRDCIRQYVMYLSSGTHLTATSDVRDVDRENETFVIEYFSASLSSKNESPKLILELKQANKWVPKGLEDKIGK